MNKETDEATLRDLAIVVYTGRAPYWIFRFLRPGFRHCFVIVNRGPFWILIDGLCHQTVVSLMDLDGLTDYLVRIHRSGGHCQITRTERAPSRKLRLMPYTCVECVKRVLGKTEICVLTPFQLFKSICKNNLDKRTILSDGRHPVEGSPPLD